MNDHIQYLWGWGGCRAIICKKQCFGCSFIVPQSSAQIKRKLLKRSIGCLFSNLVYLQINHVFIESTEARFKRDSLSQSSQMHHSLRIHLTYDESIHQLPADKQSLIKVVLVISALAPKLLWLVATIQLLHHKCHLILILSLKPPLSDFIFACLSIQQFQYSYLDLSNFLLLLWE